MIELHSDRTTNESDEYELWNGGFYAKHRRRMCTLHSPYNNVILGVQLLILGPCQQNLRTETNTMRVL